MKRGIGEFIGALLRHVSAATGLACMGKGKERTEAVVCTQCFNSKISNNKCRSLPIFVLWIHM